jgi:hypothetical protein
MPLGIATAPTPRGVRSWRPAMPSVLNLGQGKATQLFGPPPRNSQIMKKLILSACVFVCAASIFGQGTVTFNNHVVGSVVTHIYAPLASNPCWTQQQGNGTADTPAGTTDWSGWTLLADSGFTAQLWAAPGLNQPESSLVPASPTTVMRTGAGAGYVAGITATLPNVAPDSTAGATLEGASGTTAVAR